MLHPGAEAKQGQTPEMARDGGPGFESLGAALPFLAILLHNLIFYLNQLMFTMRGGDLADMQLLGPVHIGAVLVGGLLSPGLKPGRPLQGLWPGLALALIVVAPRLAGLELWQNSNHWRAFLTAGQGLLVAPAYYLFFTRTPLQRQATGFGLGLTAGLGALALAVFLELGPGCLYYLHAAFLGLEALVLALAFFQAAPARPVEVSGPPAPGPRKDIGLLITAMALFCLINGLLGVRLTPFVNLGWQAQAMWLPLWLAFWVVLLSRHLGRRPGAAKPILLFCAGLFVLAPALAVLREPPAVFLAIYILATTAQMAASLTITVTLGRLAANGPRLALILSSAYFMQGLMIPGFRAGVRDFSNPALLLLAGLLLAMLLYQVLRRLGTLQPVEAENTDQPSLAETTPPEMVDTSPLPQLSPREQQVAALLLKGASNREIAEECGITEHTVKTHVRRILSKFQVSSRQAFLAARLERLENHKP